METYVLIFLLAITAYAVKALVFPSTKSAKFKSKKPIAAKAIVEGEFTPRKLSRFNGHDEQEIFIAVKGVVYDVSSARSFYGPSGPYSNFAGHDASRGLAKNSFDFDVIPAFDGPLDNISDLTSDEMDALNNWESLFKRKYTVVGKLVANE